jgi:hypothetical protein
MRPRGIVNRKRDERSRGGRTGERGEVVVHLHDVSWAGDERLAREGVEARTADGGLLLAHASPSPLGDAAMASEVVFDPLLLLVARQEPLFGA